MYQNHSAQILQAWQRLVNTSVALRADVATEPTMPPALRVLNTAGHTEALSHALDLAAEVQSSGHLPPEIPDAPPTELLTALSAEASASVPSTSPPERRPSRGTSPSYLFRQNYPTSKYWLAWLPVPDWQPESAMPASRVTTVTGPPGSGKTSVAPLRLLGFLEDTSPYPAAIINSGFPRPGVRQPLADCAFYKSKSQKLRDKEQHAWHYDLIDAS